MNRNTLLFFLGFLFSLYCLLGSILSNGIALSTESKGESAAIQVTPQDSDHTVQETHPSQNDASSILHPTPEAPLQQWWSLPRGVPVVLRARLAKEAPLLSQDVVWRIYTRDLFSGTLTLETESLDPVLKTLLPSGLYFVFTGYGNASQVTTLKVGYASLEQTILLDAGGLSLKALLGKKEIPSSENLIFDVFSVHEEGSLGRKRLIARVKAEQILRLNAGLYHIVSSYGGGNATTRADVEVFPGKLTKATLIHEAARISFKLVNAPGGDALAGTAWSILTPGGDSVSEGRGAFFTNILAAGTYEVIARRHEESYSRFFGVESGKDAEVEVVAHTPSAQSESQEAPQLAPQTDSEENDID